MRQRTPLTSRAGAPCAGSGYTHPGAGYCVGGRAREDGQADLNTVTQFAQRLKAAGASVQLVETPGGHGDALYSEPAALAIRTLVGRGG